MQKIENNKEKKGDAKAKFSEGNRKAPRRSSPGACNFQISYTEGGEYDGKGKF